MSSGGSGFYLVVTGQIDGCKISGYDNLYCKYSFTKGLDWNILSGVEHAVSQISKQSNGELSDLFVWNYPIDITFKSSNVHGWPQIVVAVYGSSIIPHHSQFRCSDRIILL
jgi:B9 domain-containing protein 1